MGVGFGPPDDKQIQYQERFHYYNRGRWAPFCCRVLGMSVGQSWRWEIEVRGQELIITLPGTNYRAIYHKPDSSPQLVARSVPKGDEAAALVSREEFLAHASELANDKARELGWIV